MTEPAEKIEENKKPTSDQETQGELRASGDPISVSADNQNTSAIIAKGDAKKENITSGKADASANSNQNLGFQPKIGFERKEKKEPFLNRIGFHLDTTALGSFYGLFRLGGYFAQGGYNKWQSSLGRGLRTEPGYAWLRNILGDEPKRVLNTAEAVGFSGLATTFAAIEMKEEHRDCDLAVAAEKGKNPRAIGFGDLRHSKNPIVQSEIDRYLWQNGISPRYYCT